MKAGYKLCPYCGEEIKEGAIKCQHCKEFLNNEKVKKNEVEKKVQTDYLDNKPRYGLFIKGNNNETFFFKNTPYNYIVYGLITLIILICGIIDSGEPIDFALFLGIPIIFFLLFISQRSTSIEFFEDKIDIRKTKKYQSLLPKYEYIQLSYNEIESIKIENPGNMGIFILLILFWRATIDENNPSTFWIFVFCFVVFILPFILWRNNYSRIVIKLKEGQEYRTIKTTSIKGSPNLIRSKLSDEWGKLII